MEDFLDWELELTRPLYLLGLLVVPLLAVYFYRSLVDFSRTQRLISLVVRSVIVLLLVLALAGLAILLPTDRRFVVVAVDQSLSVDDDAAKKIEDFLRELTAAAGSHEVAVLPFATEPATVVPLRDDIASALSYAQSTARTSDPSSAAGGPGAKTGPTASGGVGR